MYDDIKRNLERFDTSYFKGNNIYGRSRTYNEVKYNRQFLSQKTT